MRVGLGVSEDLPLTVQAAVARETEAAGLASLWTNEATGRDALHLCQAWGAATSAIDVGVGVAPLWTRTPAQLAMAGATLQEATDGRFVLGIGVSHPATMGPWHGVAYQRPLAAAADLLAILGEAWSGNTTDRAGAVLSSRGFRLAIAPLPRPPQVLLAAMGPRMLDLAGAEADGTLLNWSSPGEVSRAGARVRAAARRAGRETCEVAAYVRVAVHEDPQRARAALAREIGRYAALPAYAAHFERQGFGATVAAVREAYRQGGDAAVTAAVPDEVLGELGWYGTPHDLAEAALDRYQAAGLDHLVARVVVAGDDPLASIRATIAALSRAEVTPRA